MLNESLAQLVHANERVDSFIRENIKIIQSPDYFAFSVDAILLAEFIKLPERRSFRYIDFCSGNGVIPLLLSHRTKAPLLGVEIQKELVDMARRSIQLNGLTEQIQIIEADVNDLTKPQPLFDIISCNPPYFPVDRSKDYHHLSSHAMARHELTLTLDQWIYKAAVLLREKGRLFLVHRPDRLDDITETLLKHQFSLHRIRFVHPKANQKANAVLIEAIYRGGRQGVIIDPPIVVHTADNQYTEEMRAIYFG